MADSCGEVWDMHEWYYIAGSVTLLQCRKCGRVDNLVFPVMEAGDAYPMLDLEKTEPVYIRARYMDANRGKGGI